MTYVICRSVSVWYCTKILIVGNEKTILTV